MSLAEKAGFWLYNLGWGLAMPALRLNHRLAEGFEQRTLQYKLPAADLWIQAASVGESYLAWELLKHLKPTHPVRVLVTSNTKQGLGILERAIKDITPNERRMSACAAYFPFDKPTLMKKAVRNIRPKVMVLLESEMWPGLLSALKKYRCKTVIINGRITSKSLSRYLAWPSLWQSLRPDKIFAISENDATRFAALFGRENVGVMSNIKFDRLACTERVPYVKNPLKKIFRPDTSLLVLGSVRHEEEPLIETIILDIRDRQPNTVIGLFPRHMHRIKYWEETLSRLEIPWALRSKTDKHVSNGTVILWDTFGELTLAYGLSKAAFVGGSLAPLGGQNFLEALTCGIAPVIGPYWENFAWVGREIVEQGLVREAADWKQVADILADDLKRSPPYEKTSEATLGYVKNRQGGTAHACRVVVELLNINKVD